MDNTRRHLKIHFDRGVDLHSRNGTGCRGLDGRGQCVLHVELFPSPQITFVVLVESNFFHRHHVQVRRGVDVAGGPYQVQRRFQTILGVDVDWVGFEFFVRRGGVFLSCFVGIEETSA